MLTDLLLSGRYGVPPEVNRVPSGKITSPHYIHVDLSERRLWRLEDLLRKVDENFTHAVNIAYNRDHLIDFCKDVKGCTQEVQKLAIKHINEFGEFVEMFFKNDRFSTVFGKDNKFKIARAEPSYYQRYHEIKKIHVKTKNGKRVKDMEEM